jgi:RIO1 family protein
MNIEIITRERLCAADWTRQHGKSSPIKPEIYFLEWEGQALCIKDFSRCSRFVRNTVGRWTVNKEASVLKRLENVSGVPNLVAVIDGPALVMERLDAEGLPKPSATKQSGAEPLLQNAPTPQFFEEASSLLATLHREGVTHGDIHSNNLLLRSNGLPSLIDFASAIVRDNRMSRLKCWAWRTMARIDLISLINLRQRHFPGHPLTYEEATLLQTQPAVYLLHNKLRMNVIRPVKKFFRSG